MERLPIIEVNKEFYGWMSSLTIKDLIDLIDANIGQEIDLINQDGELDQISSLDLANYFFQIYEQLELTLNESDNTFILKSQRKEILDIEEIMESLIQLLHKKFNANKLEKLI